MSDNNRKSLLFITDQESLAQTVLQEMESKDTRVVTATNDAEARLKLGG